MNKTELEILSCNYSDPEHLTAIGNLINAYIEDDMGGGQLLSPLKKLRLVDGLNRHPTSIVLLAKANDIFCGMLIAFENFSTFTVQPMINIHDLIVLPQYRGKRIGRTLLEAIIEIGRKKECSRVTLEVRHDNFIAQKLYKIIGFEEADPSMFYWRKML